MHCAIILQIKVVEGQGKQSNEISSWGSSADVGSATPSYRLWASISLIREIFNRLVH